jgi:hypothetical protein
MKKIYLLTFSLFALSQVKAQTTYTIQQQYHEPVIGDSYGNVALDTAGTALPMSVSGTGAVWNVTNVTQTGTTTINTYSSAASSTNSPNYPGTTMVQSDGTTNTYFKSSTNMLELLGVDAGQFDLNYNVASATIATYPMTYGYTNTDNTVEGNITATTPLGQLMGTFIGTLTTEADGAGTLNVNGASNFTNAIRVKTIQHLEFDLATPLGQIQGTIDQTLFNFYHSTSKFPVFSASYTHISAPSAGIDQNQAQISTLSNVAIGVRENQKNEIAFKAYPNPANADVNLYFVIAHPESYSVEISNNLGQVVKTMALNNLQPGMYNETINTSDLGSGIYTVKVSGKNAQGTQKLVIQK